MMTETLLASAVLLCCAAGPQGKGPAATPPLACNMKALSAAERAKYRELVARLHGRPFTVRGLRDGYEVRFADSRTTWADVAAWPRWKAAAAPS